MAKRCVHGKLKNPTGRRRCKKRPSGKSRTRRSTSKRRTSCKHGMLKNPSGRRRCRKAPRGSSRTSSKRRPAGMAKKGSRCLRFKRVRVRGGGMQKRCARYGR